MITFIIKETLRAIRKAKLYFFLSVITMFISVFLIQASLVTNKIITDAKKNLSNTLTMQVFVSDSITSAGLTSLEEQLRHTRYITGVEFLTKQQAESLFVKETGEDFRKILDYNPLPSSFILKIDDGIVSNSQIDSLIGTIKGLPSVNDVSFETDMFKIVMHYFKQARLYIVILTIILTLIAIYISFSMAIVLWHLRREEVKIMHLVGSSGFTIKFPILLNGIIVGIFGAASSLFVWYVIYRLILHYFSSIPVVLNGLTPILIATSWIGAVIGLLSAGLAVIRLKK